jgi:hypothetical protein
MDIGRRHPQSVPKGGVFMGGEDDVSEIREILKGLGKKILEGNFIDVMRISRPAILSSPYTYHHCISLDWLYCEFLK